MREAFRPVWVLALVFGIVGVGALSACATTQGTKIEASDAAAFIHKGKTTKVQLVQKFGQPTQDNVGSNGKETLVWYYSKSTADPKSFIPIVGFFVGNGGKMDSNALEVLLDKRKVVLSYQYMTGVTPGGNTLN